MGGVRNGTIAGLVAALALTACGSNRDPILFGQRYGTRVPLAETLPDENGEFPVITGEVENESRPISLPAPTNVSAWPQRGSDAQNRIPHAAVGTVLTEAWAANIGQGNRARQTISADPVAAGGRIFTLDSLGLVTATSTAGATIWQADITAGFDRGGGISGGGLALGGDTLYATNGYGELVAMDAATGAVRWRQRLGAEVTTPTVDGDLVYVVSRDNAAWAIETGNGRIRWQFPAAPANAVLQGGAAPAVADRNVIFPFGSGELVAALRQSGVRVWGTTVAGSRRGVAYSNINDITGDPVIVGGTLYAGNQSGRVVAIEAASGERIWTAQEGAYSPVLPAGDSVFFVSDRNELIRLDATTGERIWGVELPLFVNDRVRRHRAVFTHFGPILAGGQLVVASGDGAIRIFDPEDGSEVAQRGIRGGAAANPIVMDGTLYVVSADGRLHAYR
ncbi:PQQ-binding-like beta-propeller repeat protein [Rhodobacterales bacterium HKCCE3408]|nr:PQQ-binding-like beta-propeller repeat protein [Rhodobacterales bacterium HKCCE3408]